MHQGLLEVMVSGLKKWGQKQKKKKGMQEIKGQEQTRHSSALKVMKKQTQRTAMRKPVSTPDPLEHNYFGNHMCNEWISKLKSQISRDNLFCFVYFTVYLNYCVLRCRRCAVGKRYQKCYQKMSLTAFLPYSLLGTRRQPERKHPGPVPFGILKEKQTKIK